MRGLVWDKDRLWRSELGPCGELGEGQGRPGTAADWVHEGSGRAGSPDPGRGEHTWQYRDSLCLRGPRLDILLSTCLLRCIYGQAVRPGF